MEKKHIFALEYDDSINYGVAVEKNRLFLVTVRAIEHICNRRTFFGSSVSLGLWRCLFYPKGGRDALFIIGIIVFLPRRINIF